MNFPIFLRWKNGTGTCTDDDEDEDEDEDEDGVAGKADVNMELFGYCLESGVIDWTLLTTCTDYRKRLSETFCALEERSARAQGLIALHDFERFYWDAIDLAHRMGSDGHFLKLPHIGLLPSSGQQRAFLIWTDDDHGSIFVISPVEMPWLGKVAKC